MKEELRPTRRLCHLLAALLLTLPATLAQLTPASPPDQGIEIRSSGQVVFIIRNPTLKADFTTVPVFKALIENKSRVEWANVVLDISATAACTDGSERIIKFTTSVSNIRVGTSPISDGVVSARNQLENCRSVVSWTASMKGSAPPSEAPSAITDLEKARQRLDQREAEIRGAVKIEQALALKDAEDKVTRDSEAEATCGRLYRLTSDKKLSELTVKEDLAVKACVSLGYYK